MAKFKYYRFYDGSSDDSDRYNYGDENYDEDDSSEVDSVDDDNSSDYDEE